MTDRITTLHHDGDGDGARADICTCASHRDGAVFYVTAMDDLRRWLRLSGPYTTHQAALDAKPDMVRWACAYDPHAPWYLYGTMAEVTDTPVPGAFERLSGQLAGRAAQ